MALLRISPIWNSRTAGAMVADCYDDEDDYWSRPTTDWRRRRDRRRGGTGRLRRIRRSSRAPAGFVTATTTFLGVASGPTDSAARALRPCGVCDGQTALPRRCAAATDMAVPRSASAFCRWNGSTCSTAAADGYSGPRTPWRLDGDRLELLRLDLPAPVARQVHTSAPIVPQVARNAGSSSESPKRIRPGRGGFTDADYTSPRRMFSPVLIRESTVR